jgi:hypothetical protein
MDQLEQVKRMQELWSDNSVSCTVYYRKEELPEIKKYLKKHYKNSHKSLSFLLHSAITASRRHLTKAFLRKNMMLCGLAQRSSPLLTKLILA